MSNKALSISLVIPVYNEESHLEACLRSAIAQREQFSEILVIDNNSTDGTTAIAERFSGVRVIQEPKQGVVHARNRGFNEATGALIARIDADTVLPQDWTEQVQLIFTASTVSAVSGAISYTDISGRQLVDKVDLVLRSWLARKMVQHVYLLGANMAIRRSAWLQVRPMLCLQAGLHEDLDLSAHLGELQLEVIFAPQLLAGVSGRRIDTPIRDFISYLRPMPETYAVHNIAEYRYMYPVIAIVFMHYLPLRLLYRGYDEQSQRFSLAALLFGESNTPAPIRVNPVTFVD